MDSWLRDVKTLRIKDISLMLRSINSFHSLKNRDVYENRIKNFQKCLTFPWRDEQKQFIDIFLEFKHIDFVLHALYGAGKSTTLFGLLIHGLLKGLFKPQEVLFLSYNVSIKNETKRKLKDFGISSKVKVRTFDSFIYEICKIAKYPYLDLPNFDGKRKFVYELLYNKEFTHMPEFQPKIIIIDECQDIDVRSHTILKHFYKSSKFVFAGDIFQSIALETRESLLWNYMISKEDPTVYKMYMSVTPRVPQKTLDSIKTALKIYYPEFKDKINNWVSSNTTSNADIVWKRLNSYTHIFEELRTFLDIHTPEEAMILTFSSAITVNGSQGDIARLRRFFNENGIGVNTDHKKMDPDKYFLTTSNSSKGLERDYVIIFLTFPLELAFKNLSDDIVMNLITVALTRAKKQVIIFVPSWEDKFSRCLSLFENCPLPNKTKIREGKTLTEFKFQDYIDTLHCVTELIRASVIKYDTRIKIREHLKPFNIEKIFDLDVSYKTMPIATEEDRAFVGVLIENLITSTWTGRWPNFSDFDVSGNPMYNHILGRINASIKRYKDYTKSKTFNQNNQFDGILLFSQIHIALGNKIFVKLSDSLTANLKQYWYKLKPKAMMMKPNENKLKIQVPLQMPWLDGVADSVSCSEDEKTTEIYEIKASSCYEWKDNAEIQAICYALMTGKTWSRIHLLNPFMNQKISYYFETKQILMLRMLVIQDILIYNTNSMFAKMYPKTKLNKKLDVSKTSFLNIKRNKEKKIIQASLINMVSPIKCELLFNKYVTAGDDVKKVKGMTKENRFACESNMTSEELEKELKDILHSSVHYDKVIWSFDGDCDLIYTNSIKHFYDIKDFNDIVKFLEYEIIEERKYRADFSDSFFVNIFCLSFMFLKNNFV